MSDDFAAILKYRKTEEGGRKSPAVSGYRPHVRFAFTDSLSSGRQTFIDADLVYPGQEVKAEIKLMTPEIFAYRLEKGMPFEFGEGPNVIGTGVITEVLNPLLLRDDWMAQHRWKADLKKQLDEPVELAKTAGFLGLLKARGIGQEEVRQFLNEERSNCRNEEREDRILEVLDVVDGWCNPRLRIWD